jgi:light-regulated signal transduction histidine kinase (bacteriophytochrome)
MVRYGKMPVIQADEAQITRLFQNLLQNALKFRREGVPPAIEICTEKTDAGQVFSVHDNGIGIEDQYFERIFNIFQRLHTREQYPGTGIGLSICKRIVERHGGKIWLESTAAVGTTFYFSIPGDVQ